MSQQKSVPSCLGVLLNGLADEYYEYLPKIGYHIVFTHGQWSAIPAVIAYTERTIIATDRRLIVEVYNYLPKRRTSRIETGFYLVNKENTVGFPQTGLTTEDRKKFPPQILLTRGESEDLLMRSAEPFHWAANPTRKNET